MRELSEKERTSTVLISKIRAHKTRRVQGNTTGFGYDQERMQGLVL